MLLEHLAQERKELHGLLEKRTERKKVADQGVGKPLSDCQMNEMKAWEESIARFKTREESREVDWSSTSMWGEMQSTPGLYEERLQAIFKRLLEETHITPA
jgi:hypothetical protein